MRKVGVSITALVIFLILIGGVRADQPSCKGLLISDDNGSIIAKEAIEKAGMTVERSSTIPQDLSGYNVVIVESYSASNPTTAGYLENYLVNGGGVITISGVAYLLGVPLWIGASSYRNVNYANKTVAINNPFGTNYLAGDVIGSYDCCGAAAMTDLYPEATRIVDWNNGYSAGYTYEYKTGRVMWSNFEGHAPEIFYGGVKWAATPCQDLSDPEYEHRITDPLVGSSLNDINTDFWTFGYEDHSCRTGGNSIDENGVTLSGQLNYLGWNGSQSSRLAKWMFSGDFRVSVFISNGYGGTRRNHLTISEVESCTTFGSSSYNYNIWGGGPSGPGTSAWLNGIAYYMSPGESGYFLIKKVDDRLYVHKGNISGVDETSPIVLNASVVHPDSNFIVYAGVGCPNGNTMLLRDFVLETEALNSCPLKENNAYLFYEDFEGYNIGYLNGQGNWNGSALFNVSTSQTYKGVTGVKGKGHTPYDVATIEHEILQTKNFVLTFYLQSNSVERYQGIRVLEGNNEITSIATDAFGFRDNLGVTGSSTANTWYKMELRVYGDKHDFIVDDGSTLNLIGRPNKNRIMNGVDKIQLVISLVDETAYFDEINIRRYIPTEPIVLPPTAPPPITTPPPETPKPTVLPPTTPLPTTMPPTTEPPATTLPPTTIPPTTPPSTTLPPSTTSPPTAPPVVDSDGDGWSDAHELNAGTDSNNKDTDGDGYWDSLDPNPLDPNIPEKLKETIEKQTDFIEKIVSLLDRLLSKIFG